MKTQFVMAGKLLPGDVIVGANIIVESVQSLGSMVIVDFTDRTASPPVPFNGRVEIRKRS